MKITKNQVQRKISRFDLVKELAITDFKIKYQGSLLGYAWSLAKPLAMFGVLYLVFTVFVKIGSTIQHYALYLLLGIVMWTYFTDLTNNAMHSVADKGEMMRKVYFPRITIILATSISATITLFLNLLVVFVFLFVARIFPGLEFLLFILVLFEYFIFCLGISLLISAIFVKYRDVSHIWEVVLQLIFYASAIIYPLTIVPLRFQKLIIMSPVTQIIQDSRYLLVTKESATATSVLGFPLLLIPYAIPFILLIIGYLYFNRSAKNFAEEA